MKRYLFALALAAIIILVYRLVPIRLFALDIPRQINNALFTDFFNDMEIEQDIIILNTGKLTATEVKSRIDSILLHEPAVIGINRCDFDKHERFVFDSFHENQRVVMSSCENGDYSLSAIVEDKNIVTHFRSDNPSSFEIVLSNSWENLRDRNNKAERIFYHNPNQRFFQVDLYDLDRINLEMFTDKILLIGYKGDYSLFLGQDQHLERFKSSRITPMNISFGNSNILPDMYDVQISANIISTIRNGDFITEVNDILRIGILLLICLLNVVLISLFQTRWFVLNLILDFIIFVVLTIAGTSLIVYLFSEGYYLELNELVVLLIIVTVFTAASIYREKKVQSDQQT